MRHNILSPLINDTFRFRRHMRILAGNELNEDGDTYWRDISSVFCRDPMKPGKWFYQLDFSDNRNPVRLGDKTFAIEREWFKKYFQTVYMIDFTSEQQRQYIALNRPHNSKVETYFKRIFRNAGITEYLFLLGPYDTAMAGIGFLDEGDAIVARGLVDDMRWDGDDFDYFVS